MEPRNVSPYPRLQDETNLRLEAENNLAAYRQVRGVEGWGAGAGERVNGNPPKHGPLPALLSNVLLSQPPKGVGRTDKAREWGERVWGQSGPLPPPTLGGR